MDFAKFRLGIDRLSPVGRVPAGVSPYGCLNMAAISTRARAEGLKLYVAPGGNDRWSGRLAEPKQGDGPFRTLERIRDEIRKIKKQGGLPAGGVTVELRGGVYELATPLRLTAEDSGAEGTPIIYHAKPGEEVRLVGGVQVTNFQPVTDPAALKRIDPSARGKVLGADLKALGVKDFGQVIAAGNRLELFFQDKPMTLARWPNEGFVRIVDVGGGRRIASTAGRATRSAASPTTATGPRDGSASATSGSMVTGSGTGPTSASKSSRSTRCSTRSRWCRRTTAMAIAMRSVGG